MSSSMNRTFTYENDEKQAKIILPLTLLAAIMSVLLILWAIR